MLKYIILDTETDGLNIRTSKPFMIQYLFADEHLQEIEKGIFYLDHRNDKDKINHTKFILALTDCNTIVGANIKFDVHMLVNAGIDIELFRNKNYIDIEVLARLCIDNDTQTDKTFSVALKKLATRYIGATCADEEHKLKMELSRLILQHKQGMVQYFISKGLWDTNLSLTASTKLINEIYGDAWFKNFDTHYKFKTAREEYLNKYPTPTYKDINNINAYALTDVILTHGLFKLWYPMIPARGQTDTLVRVSKATFPLILMEREGLVVDINKVVDDRKFLLAYKNSSKIYDPRTGKEVSINQHKVLKEIYEYEIGYPLDSADKNVRDQIEEQSPTAKQVNNLSKLEKLINTYATRLLRDTTLIDGEYKIFTQYKMAGTITGRLSSDFQQFPKESTEVNGRTVSVRDWFIVPKTSKYMFYFDYSQLELRLQCQWTALINGQPDRNMARAFTPFECTEREGKWYLNEDLNTEWTPTDLHAMTAQNAFPDKNPSSPDWKHIRTLGKRCNFAANYGASASKIAESLHVFMPIAKRLVDGYKQTFKGIMDYVAWIKRSIYTSEYLPNLFLRRYYSRNAHQLQNWLVQGSGADLLLIKLKELSEYLKDKPHWRLLITVHDEVGFTCGDIPRDQLIKEVNEIKNLMGFKFSDVDVISDVEVTTTSWGQKQDWSEDLI